MFLMKPGTSIEAAVRDLRQLERHHLVPGLGLDGALFVKTTVSDVPWWVDFLNPLAVDDLRAPTSRTTSAVLSLRLARAGPNSRTVCFTFGHGRHLLDQARVDRSFGLRVALNAVDPRRLRGFDLRRQEDVVFNARIQTSTGTDMGSFDLDAFRDILRGAAGGTQDQYSTMLGSLVRGSIGVTFDVPINVEDLAVKARELLQLFRKNDYKETFPFVDFVQPVDLETSEELDDSLTRGLTALGEDADPGFRSLYLAAPEVLDLEIVEGFVFSSEWGSAKTVHPELRLLDYVVTRAGRDPGLSSERAKTDRVMVRLEGDTDRLLASVYRCLIAEVTDGADTHQLVDGHWYRIESSFVARVREQLAKIPEAAIPFPPHHDGEEEQLYNTRAAVQLGALLLDRKNIPIGGGTNRIEFCDIAFHDRTLVHIKKRSSSSTLSHLWSQATVSLDALLGDSEFREQLRTRIQDLDPTYVDIVNDGLKGTDYSVIYLVLGVEGGMTTWEALPFFSQVALAQAVRTLGNMGVSVALASV